MNFQFCENFSLVFGILHFDPRSLESLKVYSLRLTFVQVSLQSLNNIHFLSPKISITIQAGLRYDVNVHSD